MYDVTTTCEFLPQYSNFRTVLDSPNSLYPRALRADNLSISSDGLRLGLFTQCILALIAVPGLPGQQRFRQVHRRSRDILDRIQDMYREPGLESVLLDVDKSVPVLLLAVWCTNWCISTLSRVIEALRQWESLSPYQAIVDEGKIATCLELGFEREWAKNYIRAKELDDRDLEEKLLRIAEESPEPAIENPEPMGVQSSVPSTSTAMGRLARDGFTRSRITQRHLDASSSGENFLKGLEALTKEVHDSITTVAQHQPLLNAHQLSPIVAPLMDELLSIRDKPLGEQTDSPMLQVTHVPFVTISDINKMEDAHYLRNIRDLSLQIRLYSGHPMRGNGSIMTYLANILEDKFIPDTDFEEQPPIKKNMGATLVAVRLCQPRPDDQILYKLLQRPGGWGCPRSSLFTFKRATSRGATCGKLDCAVVHDRDNYTVSQGAVFVGTQGTPRIGGLSLCSKFEVNPPLSLVIRLAGQSALRCMAPEYIRGRVSCPDMMLSADIFTHKTPFEGVPMPHGLVAFLVQGPIPNHPSTTLTEVMSTITPVRPILKRKRTPAYTIPATSDDALKAAAIAAAEVLPSEEEGQRVVERGLSDKMWSLLQSCWKYEPRARPTMNKILQSLNEIAPTSAIGVKNITAQVRKTTIFPVATGGQCDIFLGEFVTFPHEKVAMKRLRVFHDRELEPVRKELMREVRLWSELSHPNVLEFYGLYDAGGMSIYMISGWMSNGNAPDYLLKYPDANRRDIVSFRCFERSLLLANILIKEDCTACLSDLGLARASHEATITSMRGNGSIRYMSPEILLTNDESGTLRIPIKTMESDIFAFGLVIRELLGNEIPYSEIQSIPHIIRLIASGSRPSRPKNLIASEWLCDKMWEIVEAALAGNPELRPTACELSQHLSRIPMATRHAPRRRVSEPNPPRPKLREGGYMRWALSEL
ncbi:protein tyrosine kinase domain-containing protein [Rhizoctonia solani AG-1 IA]|uniref:Protein tyrosine kinase domain-containing protein n=1 Tax=Thanatephorus cucumeris (strain AG1-IA) TaxID=983506 RepID=L8X025_THACA|nr:protein tyrosine kinase domain-containing protein [Rhizoctonia solani AG-1 IA]